MKFRPCIDLHQGKVKQIVGGSLKDRTMAKAGEAEENFVSSHGADYYAELYRKNNLTGGHMIKLGPDNDTQALLALKTWPGGLQIGGGINQSNASQWLKAGASHVIVTSCIFEKGRLNMKRVQQLCAETGRERLVLDLSCRHRGNEWLVVTDRWQTFTDFSLTEESLHELSSYCDEFLIHGVDVEGKQCGIEKDLVSLLSRESNIPVTYAGGIGSWGDIKLIEKLGEGKIDFTVGSALDIFGGSLSFNQLRANY